MTDAPTLLPVLVDTIPADLRAMNRWVLWNLQKRDGTPTKVPYQVKHPGTKADTTNASTWADFATARDAYLDGKADGLGFVLGDGVFGFDADGCRDPQTGAIAPDVAAYITMLNTYTEVSPRGAGLHAIGRGQKPGNRCRTGRYELYDSGRFFCMTGHALPGTPATVEFRPNELAHLYTCLFSPKTNGNGQAHHQQPNPLDDDDALIAAAMAARNGSLFASLWAGDTSAYSGDDSAADLALCNLLTFWTDADAGRID